MCRHCAVCIREASRCRHLVPVCCIHPMAAPALAPTSGSDALGTSRVDAGGPHSHPLLIQRVAVSDRDLTKERKSAIAFSFCGFCLPKTHPLPVIGNPTLCGAVGRYQLHAHIGRAYVDSVPCGRLSELFPLPSLHHAASMFARGSIRPTRHHRPPNNTGPTKLLVTCFQAQVDV